MSVINKMLRDLDKQQQLQGRAGQISFRPQANSHWWLWAVVPVALVAGWYGQSWYMDSKTGNPDRPVTEAKKTPKQLALHQAPQAAAQVAGLDAENSSEVQEISLKDVVASRLSPELAAQLPSRQKAEPEAGQNTAQSTQLQPFLRKMEAEQRVVQLEPDDSVTEDQAFISDSLSTDEVQVQSLEQSQDWSAEEQVTGRTDWSNNQTQSDKPRSLAIEKVELSPEQQKEALKKNAQKAEFKGNLSQAVLFWQQIRQLNPTATEAYLELSRLAQLQHNDSVAVQVLQQAMDSVGQQPEISMALAALAVKQQDWAKALGYLQYQPDSSRYPDFFALKAAALQKNSQHAQAIEVFQQLVRQQPQQGRWWLGMALSYDALQQQEQALQAYRQVMLNGFGLSADSLDYVKKRIVALE
jgi:MSHA biogenesis protein MshN